MSTLDSYIISILESYIGNLQKDNLGFPSFSPSGTWEEILTKFSLFKFPLIETDVSKSLFPAIGGTKSTEVHVGGFATINPDYKNYRIEGFYKLEYASLYPSIIYKFVKSERIEQSLPVRIFCYLFSNKKNLKKQLSGEGYLVMKLWLNWFFGKISSSFPEIDVNEIYTEAKRILMNAIEASDEWYYGDVDILFFWTEDLKAFEDRIKIPGLEFEISKVDKGVFIATKKYIIGDSNTTIIGFHLPKKKK